MPEKLILKHFDSEVKEVKGERALNVTITTNDVDRSGDIVEPKGAKLTNFKKNPVVLMAHDYQGLPIGKAKDLVKTDNGITAKVIFPEEGTYPLADTVFNLYKQGFMKAWSIGFIPIKSEDIVDDEDKDSKTVSYGRRFKTWELLEFSACSVPANPNALGNMLSKGIDVEPLKEAGFIEITEEKGEDVYDDETTDEVEELIKDGLKDIKVDEIDEEKVKASIEEDEKEEYSIDDLIEKICEVNIENKDLKEKLKEVELKAGAVLNAKNKSNLKKAQDLIQSVLDSAGTTEEDPEKVVDDKKNDKGDDGVVDIVTDTVDNPVIDEEKNEAVEEAKFTAKIEKAINQSMTDNRKYFNEKLDYAIGRVPEKNKKKGCD